MNTQALLTKIILQPKNIFKKVYFEYLFDKQVLRIIRKKENNLFFINIGAHDGSAIDPLAKYIKKFRFKGIMIEPQKKPFNRLVTNYKSHNQLIFERSAITRNDERTTLHVWKDGFSSLIVSPEKLSSIRKIRQLKMKPKSIKVNGMSMKTLLKKHKIKTADIIIIDTEGYDYEILKLIDFKKLQTRIIQYESVLLSNKDKEQSIALLEKCGYKTFTDGWDSLAYLE